jgi:hypothetical protein
LGSSLIHLPPFELAASCSRYLRASSTIPLVRSTCPLARGWATETYQMSIPLFSQYSQNWWLLKLEPRSVMMRWGSP